MGDSGASSLSIPISLELGVIDEAAATAEIFCHGTLPKNTLLAVWGLLRTDAARAEFGRILSAWSGVLVEDMDSDNISEAWAAYENGRLTAYRYDGNQDGLPDITIAFTGNSEPTTGTVLIAGSESATAATLNWQPYPALREVRHDGIRYTFAQGALNFTPVRFDFLAAPDGPPWPEISPRATLSPRSLAAFAVMIEKPGAEFPTAIERIEMRAGIPLRSREFLSGRLVAETDYTAGTPTLRRVDLDLDGRLETLRLFSNGNITTTNSDWDNDAIYEYEEIYE
jgi:hypothetical protein